MNVGARKSKGVEVKSGFDCVLVDLDLQLGGKFKEAWKGCGGHFDNGIIDARLW